MSLGFALDVTMRGLLSTTSKIQLVSQNITNAGNAGYTRKEAQDSYITTNGGTVPIKSAVVGSTNKFLTKAVVKDVGEMGAARAISEILEYYTTQLGSTSGTSTMSSYLNSMYGALQQLATTPEVAANKTETVQIAANLADSLNNLSADIQELRLQADQKILSDVNTINQTIQKIHDINVQMNSGTTSSVQMADLEDQRMAAIESLAGTMDIQYFFNTDNQVQLYTKGGQPLLLSQPLPVSYTPTNLVNSSTVFQPILLNGVDITNSVRSGSLAGNIAIRDTILPQEQAKLDEFANVMREQINTVLNRGSSMPPQTTITGSLQGLGLGTPLSATGNLRVAVTDLNGILQNYVDIDLTTTPTVGDLITALNAIPNVSASLGPNNELVIASTLANTGISLNELNSSVSPSGQGASMFFGLQDLFIGTSASDLRISPSIKNNQNYLPTGVLNAGAVLTPGTAVLTRGDGTIALAMSKILTANVSFGAAGNFAAQTNTLMRYAESIIADGASRAAIADQQYETANLIYGQTKETLNNYSGVNIDEETTKMLALQNNYQASARMIAAIRDMFDSLIDAVR